MKAKRKPKPPTPRQKSTISIRVSPDLKRFLDRQSVANDRSLSAEAEFRLEKSQHDQDQAVLFAEAQYGRQLAAVLEVLGRAMRDAAVVASMKVRDPDGDEAYLFNQGIEAAATVLEAMRPRDSNPRGDLPVPLVVVGDPVPAWVPSELELRKVVGKMVANGIIEALGNPERGGDIGDWAAKKRERLGPIAKWLAANLKDLT
jgi:hypothetical protein